MCVGDKVRVLYPFNTTFDGVYSILSIDGSAYFLEGIEGGFDAIYLEAV